MEPIAHKTERKTGQHTEQLQETPRRTPGRTAPWGSQRPCSLIGN